MHISSFTVPPVVQIIATFITPQDPSDKTLSQGYVVNRLSNTSKEFSDRHTDLLGQYKKNVCQIFSDSMRAHW